MNSFHPVLFSKQLSSLKPKQVTLLGENYALWRNEKGVVKCVVNRCSHRGAKLSDGTVQGNNIECGYHGWQYDAKGICKNIPQVPESIKETYKPPKACNIQSHLAFVHDDIVWINPNTELKHLDIRKEIRDLVKWNNNDDYFITDYPLDAPYSYAFQIENLLDPAHLCFVHNGFQGNRDYASAVYIKNLISNDKEISANVIHENPNIPEIIMKFKIPYMVEVSILNKNKDIVRKNLIYASPSTKGRCNVLFRDVAIKEFLTPSDNQIVKEHINFFVDYFAKDIIDSHYQFINNEVVSAIMQQDIDILVGQGENVPNYLEAKYVLPTESDRLIVEFRKWLRNQTDKNLLI
jgi:phenylpropionate dioxygenase-like ring-hydroxylating dioxygenase large terminal subunit